jgi:hypothetical protein
MPHLYNNWWRHLKSMNVIVEKIRDSERGRTRTTGLKICQPAVIVILSAKFGTVEVIKEHQKDPKVHAKSGVHFTIT